MVVLNGRINGDKEERITYLGGGGWCEKYTGSVIDLVMMVDRGNLEEVKRINVVARNECDHLPVCFKIEGEKKEYIEVNKERMNERIQWKKGKKEKFTGQITRKVREEDWEEKGSKWERMKELIWEAAIETKLVTNGAEGVVGKDKRWSAEYRYARK